MEEQKKKREDAKEKDRDKQRDPSSTKRKRSKSPKKDKGKKRDDSREESKKKRGDSNGDDTLKKKRGSKRDDSASPEESESDGDMSAPGYFDEALRKLANHVPANTIPKFNADFEKTAKLPKHENLVVADDGVTPRTTRGHVTFNILGPGPKELEKLVKFFTQHGNTRGSVRNVSEDEM
jgi:hypothetical protein